MQAVQLIRFFLSTLFFISLSTEAMVQGPRSVYVFAQLEGTWQGSFVGYDEQCKELYRLRVRQVYRAINTTTQKVEIEDIMPDGTKITSAGENTAVRRPDGSWWLRCKLLKSNGERVEHEGRIVKGPEGDEQIVWYTNKPDRIEVFREAGRRRGRET